MPVRPFPADRLDGLLAVDGGLSPDAAAARLLRFGANDIIETPPGRWLDLLADTARDPMLWFLLAVSALFAVLGDYLEAAILLSALVPLIGMDAYLHRRTRASTQGLASRLAARTKVRRDGAVSEIAARDLVPGDLALVGADEAFPADGVVLSGVGLQVDESTLTGEAYPVRKASLTAAVEPPRVTAAEHWVFAGTRLLTGQAEVRIAFTGGETHYGGIVRSALAGGHARTPLQVAVANLVAAMLVVALIVCLALAAIRLIQGHGWVDAVLSAVSLAVAVLPEEFPVVFTFFLGVGVFRLAQRQALVRRAVAVENIGRVTCICTDKTGTLTEGKLELAHALPVSGGNDQELIRTAALATNATAGDPMDVALIAAAGAVPAAEQLAAFPFTEDRRRETAVLRLPGGNCIAVVKGAPETVLSMCADAAADQALWRERFAEYASSGHKVIACASRSIDVAAWTGGEPDRGYALQGLIAFEDRLREGVPEAVDACQKAGIRVVMVTGDHPATAAAIAREIGLGGGLPVVVTAEAIEAESAAKRPALLREVDVIARAAPSQKLDLVRGLQAAGEIVAVTGDGVNDVPALQAADIGIAMGERGTRSARDVAAIVLLDDNFRTIVRAIAEGRQLFRNLQLSFAYLLMIHIPLVLSAALVPLAGFPLLYLPIHIVWFELIIHPTALLVFQELPSAGPLLRAERGGPARFFGPGSWTVIGIVGLLVAGVVVLGFQHALGPERDVEHARSMAMAGLVAASATITALLSGLRSRTAWIVVLASFGSLVVLIQVPVLAAALHLRPLHPDDWALAIGGGVTAGLAAGLLHLTLRARRTPRPAAAGV